MTATAAAPPLLSCRNVGKFFGALAAVDDLSFDVRIGEVLGIGGPNGAGKTTLFELISGLNPASRGHILLSGRDITRLTPERIRTLKQEGKTVRLVSRAKRANGGLSLRVRAEVLDQTDILACVHGTSNVLLLHTDLMGTIGTVSISPAAEQTAYGVFIDLVDVWRAIRPLDR